MREIKFRFFSKVLGYMVIPDDSIFVGALKDENMCPMQYTGLKDKNGKEIYEGDIIEDWDDDRGEVVLTQWMLSNTEGFYCWGTKRKAFSSRKNENKLFHVEVIGNIYENPELLK